MRCLDTSSYFGVGTCIVEHVKFSIEPSLFFLMQILDYLGQIFPTAVVLLWEVEVCSCRSSNNSVYIDIQLNFNDEIFCHSVCSACIMERNAYSLGSINDFVCLGR
jgi:hypothetical protein